MFAGKHQYCGHFAAGLKDTEIQAAVRKFPEGLASGVEDRLKPNMQVPRIYLHAHHCLLELRATPSTVASVANRLRR